MKRLLSLLLILTVLSGLFAVPASAETAEAAVPKIEIVTADGSGAALEKADGYVSAQITVTDTDGSILSGDITLKVRGNSTAMSHVDKKSFNFKFAKKTEVLGMGKGKKWAMLANCFDPTLLRNYAVFDLAHELGLPYTSEQRFAELWLDGEYRGCYTVYEPVGEGKDRVDIDIESNGGKKDFLLELESSRAEDDVTYLTVDGLRFAFSDPDEPDEEQAAYVKQVMTGIVTALRTGSEDEIRQVIDVDSFAKFYLLNEYAKTADFGFSSVFFFCKDGVLYAGPPWDYDLALGNLNPSLTSSSKAASETDGILQYGKNLYRYLSDKDWFTDEIRRVYAEHYDYIESIAADGGLLYSLREEHAAVFDRNFTVWRVNKWWLNYQRPPLKTYDDNYTLLKDWCAERHAWLSEYYGLSRCAFLLGDADGSGTLEIVDATLIQRVLAEMTEDDDGMIAVRAALTGELDVTDATLIQRYLAGMDVPYPLNEETSVILY